MKKSNFIICGIAAIALNSQTITANDAIDFYGKIHVALVNLDEDDNRSWNLESNSSRVGVKGDYEISEGLKAIYKMEYEVAIDDGDTGNGNAFKARNTYIGVKGDFGQFLVGRHDTPVKMIQGKVDLFNDLPLGDIKNLIKSENRVDNILMYTSPSIAGNMVANVAFIPGENGENGDGLADSVSASVKYSMGDLWLGLAVDDNVDGWDVVRMASAYNLNKHVTLGFIYETAEESNSADPKNEDFALINAKYKADNVTYKLQYSVAEQDNSTGQLEDETLWTVGLDYKLNKVSKIYTYYSDYQEDISSGDKNIFGVGFELKF